MSLRSGAGRDSIGFFGRSATVQWRACRQANESPTGRGSQRRGLSRNRRSRHSNGSDWITPTAGRRSEAKRKPRRGSRTPAGLRTQHREASQRAGPSSQRGERSPVPFPSGWPRAERQSACVGPSQHDTLEVLPTEIGEHYYETSARYRGRRAALLAAASSEASAWVCLAAGAGSSGYGRDPYYVQDAKIIALRTCERRSPIPICTIVWCRPGMR